MNKLINKLFIKYKNSIILIIFLSYLLLIYLRLDNFQRKMIKYRILSMRFKQREGFRNDLLCLLILLIVPFCSNYEIYYLLTGRTYNFYIGYFYPELDEHFYSKLYWYNVFRLNGINTPSILLYKLEGKTIYLNEYSMDKYYIYKPIYGGIGIGIKKVNGKEIKDLIQNDNTDFLIQELLFDCTYKKAKHFRYNSLYTGDNHGLYTAKEDDETNITSNLGEYSICENMKCNDLDKNQQIQLDIMINKLRILHKNHFPHVFALSWDLMINCEISTSIEVFCLEGNVVSHLQRYHQKESIIDLKNKAENFYIMNGYL